MKNTDDKEVNRPRLVSPPEERPAAHPTPDLKPLLDDLKRRYRVMHERLESGDDAPGAA